MEVDRPPAGTRCITCHAGGHFCQATMYVVNSDDGLCAPCFDGKDCPVFSMRKHPVKDDGEPLDKAPKLERHTEIIPPKKTAEPKWEVYVPPMNRGGGYRVILDEVKQKVLAEPITASNTSLGIKYGISGATIGIWRRQHGIITPGMEGRRGTWKRAEREKATRLLLAGASRQDAVAQSGLSRATIDNIVKEQGLNTPTGKRGGSKPGRIIRSKQRQIAHELLTNGISVREAAAESQLSRRTVQNVRRAIPDLPKANNGGYPEHKMRGNTNGKPRNEELRSEVRMTLDKGASVRQAAEIVGCSTNTVQAVKRESQETVSTLTVTTQAAATPLPHLLIEGLVAKMPEAGTVWPSKDRYRWMDAMIKIIDLLYEDPEGGDWMYNVGRDSLK